MKFGVNNLLDIVIANIKTQMSCLLINNFFHVFMLVRLLDVYTLYTGECWVVNKWSSLTDSLIGNLAVAVGACIGCPVKSSILCVYKNVRGNKFMTSEVVTTRCGPDEIKVLNEQAAATGESRSKIIRRAILGLGSPKFDTKKAEDAIATLQQEIELLRAAANK